MPDWPEVNQSSSESSVADDERESSASEDGNDRATTSSVESTSTGAGGSPSETPTTSEDLCDADAGDTVFEARAAPGPDRVGIGIPPLEVDEHNSYDKAVNDAITALFELTRTSEAQEGSDGAPLPPSAYNYASVATKMTAVYETLQDALRAQPLTRARRGAKPGKFNTPRLRALLRFALEIGDGGFTHKELSVLYDFLDTWCGTKPGMPTDETDQMSLRDVFPSVNAFVDGFNDELRDAVIHTGWRKVLLTEGGVTYEAYFRPVLDLIMSLAKQPGVQLWSGADGPAEPTDVRQTPLDGDAFRECEKDVVLNNGPLACVLGVHVYSDGSRLSWSGGM